MLADLLADPGRLAGMVADHQVLDEARAIVEDAATTAVALGGWTGDDPLRLSKGPVTWLLRCPRRAVAAADAGGATGNPDDLAIGLLVDAGAKLAALRPAQPVTVEAALAFLTATGDETVRNHLDLLATSSRATPPQVPAPGAVAVADEGSIADAGDPTDKPNVGNAGDAETETEVDALNTTSTPTPQGPGPAADMTPARTTSPPVAPGETFPSDAATRPTPPPATPDEAMPSDATPQPTPPPATPAEAWPSEAATRTAASPTTPAEALLREAAARLEVLLVGWPEIEGAWWPRVEEPARVRLAGGAVVVSGKLDLLLGGPPTDRPGLVVEIKAGRWHDAVRSDGHLYGLLLGLRDGVAPAAVLSLAAGDGATQLEPMRAEVLRHAAERVAEALRVAAQLAAGEAPAAYPGSHCTYCPLRATCPEAQAAAA